MDDALEFAETREKPVCPHCGAELGRIDFRREKLRLATPAVFTYVVLLLCPECRKVLGTQSWGF